MRDPTKTGLSPSSLSLFQSCERRYYHYKIANTPYDEGYEEDVSSLQIGSAFHKVCEDNLHDLSKLKYGDVASIVDEMGMSVDSDTPLIYAMAMRYYRDSFAPSKRKVVAVEQEIAVDGFLGYIDVILQDKDGGWWIGDLKTHASWNPAILPTLYMHPQLNLYAGFAAYLAKALDLDVKKFRGCRYLLTTKSKLKRREKESAKDYTARLYGSVASLDIEIPLAKMNPTALLDIHNEVSRKILINGRLEGNYCRNFNSCFTYYRPCPYFSHCFPGRYVELLCQK